MTNSSTTIHLSVVMSAYNAEKWIAQAIESTLAQTYPHFEFLIVNDGSTDLTGQIIDEYAAMDARIRPIHHENWGLCRSVNHAVELAKYDLIARMDADDTMSPNRFERQMAFLAEHPDAGVIATVAEIVDIHGHIHWRVSTDLTTPEVFEQYRAEHRHMPIYQNSVIMKKSVFQRVGGHRPEFWPCDDMDLWHRIADDGTLILIQPEHLVQYRIHSDSVSVAETHKQYSMTRWVQHCTVCRRNGEAEPSYDEFLKLERRRPLLYRANVKRSILSETLYKSSSVHYVYGRKARALLPLLGSLLLNPAFLVNKMRAKLPLALRNTSAARRFQARGEAGTR